MIVPATFKPPQLSWRPLGSKLAGPALCPEKDFELVVKYGNDDDDDDDDDDDPFSTKTTLKLSNEPL